jgi:hypothetical protein
MAKRVAAATTKKKAAAGGAAAKAKRAAGGKKKPAGGAAAKAAGKTKPAAAKAREKPAMAPAVAPRAALGGGDAAASRATKLPAAALAPDVTRHDVNWGAEGARRHKNLAVSGDGSALSLDDDLVGYAWAQGAVGVTRGKHFFSVSVTQSTFGEARVGWSTARSPPEARAASGATFSPRGYVRFGSAPPSADQFEPKVQCPCTVGCLFDTDAGAMTVFVDGEPLAQQCEYRFPTDREWLPSVALGFKDALFSNTF